MSAIAKPNNPQPILFINPSLPTFLEIIKIYASDLHFHLQQRIQVGNDIYPTLLKRHFGLIEIDTETSFLIINKYSIPHSIKELPDFKESIELFLDEYEHSILLFQEYNSIINRLEGKNRDLALKIRGLFMQLFLDYGVGFVPTRNIKDSLICIRSIAKRVQIFDKPPSLARIKTKPDTLKDAQEFLLQGLALSGSKKAKKLTHFFDSPVKIFQELQATVISWTERKNVKSISGSFGAVNSFKKEFILQNQRLLFESDE